MENINDYIDIPGYEGIYGANSDGEIISYKRNLIRKQIDSHHGYKRVILRKNGNIKTYAVHRIVASLFVPNPNNYNEINHINNIKSDNRAENLEWCTREYNINYGDRIQNMSKEVAKLDDDGNIIQTFSSQAEASRATGIWQGAISNACCGRTKTAGGYKWTILDGGDAMNSI